MESVNKPVIPAEVADALDAARAAGMGNETLIGVRNEEFYALVPGLTSAVLRSIPFDTFLAAMINGYEREKSAEEIRREAYDNIRKECAFRPKSWYYDGRVDGIRFTLNTLGITIEGVNA